MIDPHWQVIDLDPVTWRELGRFIDPAQYLRTAQPDEHGLFVLHEGGLPLRVVDTRLGVRRDIAQERIDDPQHYAQQLYARGEWQRVHVIDKAHLAFVARIAQSTPHRELTLDEYYHYIYQQLWGEPSGYVSVPAHPGHWHGWTYQYIKDIVRNLPFAPASLVLGVLADGKWIIGLILVCENGLVRKVTTFEALGTSALATGLSEDTLTLLWERIAKTVAPPAGMLICSRAVFADWIQQEEKLQVLAAAYQAGQACWHWV